MSFKYHNHFAGGVDLDTDLNRMSPAHLRNLLNMRLTSINGVDHVVLSIGGTEQKFHLTDGFQPMGYAEYSGIAYIFSFNPETLQGEVGTYPSPALDCGGGFEHVYRPLQNFTGALPPDDPGAVRQDFRTTLFDFACDRQLEVEARISWDNSVDLYFADWRNSLRKLNAGFDISTGICSNRLYWEGSFPNQVNVFFESCKYPRYSGVFLDVGGALQAGNWFFYFRYKTTDFNKTSFLSECGPVQITRDELSQGVLLDGDAALTDTGRAVEITLTNLDDTFPYLEVAFSYHYDDTFKVGLINKTFAITPGTTAMTIRIDGTEPVVDMTLAELLSRKPKDDVTKSICQLDRRLLGAPWKERDVPYEELEGVSSQVLAKPGDPEEYDRLYDQSGVFGLVPGLPYGYKDYRNTLNSVGYWRGETYPFAVVYVYTDGKESLPYPVKGYDAWFDPGATTPNTLGILRFPSNAEAGFAMYRSDAGVWTTRPMGVSFDTSGAPLTDWMQENICGFYFVRGERKSNVIYQGFVTDCYNAQGIDANFFMDGCGSGPDGGEIANTWIPDLATRTGVSPDVAWAPVTLHDCNPSDTNLIMIALNRVANKHAIFSSDHFFQKTLADGMYTMVLQGYMGTAEVAVNPFALPCYVFEQFTFMPAAGFVKGKGQLYNVAARNTNVIGGGFTSQYYPGDDTYDGLPRLIYQYWNCFDCEDEFGNRDMSQRNYIALDFDVPGSVPMAIGDSDTVLPDTGGINNRRAIVNIYAADPDPSAGYDITALYDPGQVIYHKISQLIDIGDWDTVGDMIFYHGDCFMQRTYHKMLRDDAFNPFPSTTNGRYYAFGNMVGSILENNINTAMRREVGPATSDPTYFPERQASDVFLLTNNAANEADLQNHGYNVTLSLQGTLGNDVLIPYRGSVHPTRIRFSHEYQNERFSDGYMIWDLDAYRDYDFRSGEINRIAAVFGHLLSVQDTAVNGHFMNERAVLAPGTTSEAELLVGNGDILSERVRSYGDKVGSRHQWSMIKTDQALYGYDSVRRVFWSLSANGFELISDTKKFRSAAVELSTLITTDTDVLSVYPDAPVCDDGITAYWDRQYGEVGWSFIINDKQTFLGRTVVFSEQRGQFMGDRSHVSPFYLSLGQNLFSVDRAGLLDDPLISRFHRHDVAGIDSCLLYGTAYPCELQCIVAPAASEEAQVDPVFVFDAFSLRSIDIQPNRMNTNTKFQKSTKVFATATEWDRPEFKENHWHFPILRATSVINTGVQELQVESPLRGPYLEVAFQWTTPIFVDAASLFTIYRPSLT